MSRIHAFEWEDLPWFPPLLRQYLQDFLRTVAELTPLPAAPVVAEVRALVERHGSRQLVDLCSGGGGVSVVLAEALRQRHGLEVTMTLSDLFPHLDAMERLTQHRPWLRGHSAPVDATQVPVELVGMRIITNAFHHFDDEMARKILLDAQRQGQPFVATELVSRSPTGVATLLVAVAALMVVTPLTFLGGSFYSISMLPPVWQKITLFNPVVYLISGFRWSFYGVSDVSPALSLGMTLLFMLLCLGAIGWIFRTGYRLKS